MEKWLFSDVIKGQLRSIAASVEMNSDGPIKNQVLRKPNTSTIKVQQN